MEHYSFYQWRNFARKGKNSIMREDWVNKMTTRKIMVLLLLHQRKMTSDIYKWMDGYVLHVERAIHVFVLKKLLWKSHWSKEPNICLKKNAATPATSQWITTSMPKNWTLRLICRTCKQNHLTGINKYNVKKKT